MPADALIVVYLADVARASVPQLAVVMLLEMASAACSSAVCDRYLVGRWNHRALLALAVAFVVVRVAIVAVGIELVARPLSVVLVSQLPSGGWWALLQLVTSDFAYIEAPEGLGATAVAVANACCVPRFGVRFDNPHLLTRDQVGVGGILGALVGSAVQTTCGWTTVFNGAVMLSCLAGLVALRLLQHVHVTITPHPPSETNPLVTQKSKSTLPVKASLRALSKANPLIKVAVDAANPSLRARGDTALEVCAAA